MNPGWPTSEIIDEELTEEELAGIRKAVDASADVDVVIAVLGEDDNCTGEREGTEIVQLYIRD